MTKPLRKNMFPGSHRRRWWAPGLLLGLTTCGGGGGGTSPPVPLAAAFEVDLERGTAPLVVRFLDRSSGPVTSWNWDFGDGNSSNHRQPTHLYAGAGQFNPSLTVSGGGLSATRSRDAPIQVEAAPRALIEYGMNPSFSRWSSREIVFADGMMRASEFLIVRGGEFTLEPAPVYPPGRERVGGGWPNLSKLGPGERAGAWIFGAMDGSLPDGRSQPWILTWDGTGSCRLLGSAVTGQATIGGHRTEVRVDPTVGNGNGTVALLIETSNRVDPVRNVHVWLPGTWAERPLFWPPYLERVRAMNHGSGPRTWRTLDWTRVNDYGANDPPLPFAFDLAGVIRPSSPSQATRRGMCTEFQVEFCNRVGANLHLTVPHRTDDLSEDDYERYLRDLFRIIRDGSPAVREINAGEPFDGLDEQLELTIELSNELWNALFPASRWMALQASRKGLTLHQAIADELQTLWRIADEEFAGRRTVRRFVGGWIAEASFARRVLEALPVGTRVDAIGSSCYFRPRPASIASWEQGATDSSCPNCPTPLEVLEASWLSLDALRPNLLEQRLLAGEYRNPDGTHPRLELYEAGQAFDAKGGPWARAARAAQSLPEMYDAYVEGLIPLLVESGVELVNWYSFMTDQDPNHGVSVGFGIWNDMQQTITLPVPSPYLDEGAPKAAAIYRGPPSE